MVVLLPVIGVCVLLYLVLLVVGLVYGLAEVVREIANLFGGNKE